MKQNIASALKSEITKVATKITRAELSGVRSASSKHRSDIAALKKSVDEASKRLSKIEKILQNMPTGPNTSSASGEAEKPGIRYSAENFAKLRKRLNISAEDMALLLGASSLSVYKWENKDLKIRPRQQYLDGISELRKQSPRQVAEVLAAMKAE